MYRYATESLLSTNGQLLESANPFELLKLPE